MFKIEKVRVLYISNAGDWAGSTIALKNLLTNLLPLGVEPLVVCKFRGEFTEWLLKNDITVEIIDFDWSYLPPIHSVRDFLAYYWRLYKYYRNEKRCISELELVCAKFKPDIIHSNNGIIQIGFKVAKKLDLIHIWHLREYQTLDFGMKPLPSMPVFKKMLKESNCVAITKDIQRFFELAVQKSIVIYDGVMPQGSARFNPNKENYFLFVGRIEKSKGIDILIDAFIDFCKTNKDYSLKIAGDGKSEYKNFIQTKIDKAGINNRIDFLGFRDDRFDLIYNAMATIVPSRFEGFGFITIEAMMNGSMVIGNNTAGTAEIESNCKGGILLYNGSKQLNEQIHNLLKLSKIEIEKICIENQNIASKLYSIEESSQMIYNYYSQLLIKNI